MTRNTIELRQKRAGLVAECRTILKKADKASRDLTTSEHSEYDRLFAEVSGLKDRIEREENVSDLETELRQRDGFDFNYHNDVGPTDGSGNEIRPRELRDLRQGEVRVLAPDQRISDCPEIRSRQSLPDGIKPEDISLGRIVRSIITGEWGDAQAERRAMGVGSDSGGGFVLPDIVSTELIDLARNKAQIFAAGARTVPMESNTLTLAKVTADPTAAWKAENAPGASSDMTFGAVKLSAKTLFANVKVSIELAEDAGNVEQLVQQVLSDGLALKLDLAALTGNGPPIEPLGIRNVSGIQVIDQGVNGSAITDYSEMSEAWQKVLEANGPSEGLAAIYAPRTAGTMDRFVDGQGQPQTPPLSVQRMKRLVTNQVPITLTKGSADNATDIYIGDFRQVMVGMRTSVRVEVSRAAADSTESAFQNMQVWIRAYLRADVALAKPNHLVLIDGVIP